VHGRLRRCTGLLVNNHRMCSFMTNEKIDALLEELKK
jgi:NADH-quinone oxidoreductase subunit E